MLEACMKSTLIGDMARSFGLPGLKRAAGVVTRRVPIPQPLLLVGPGASARLGQAVADFDHHHVLLVTDAVVARLGLTTALTDALAARGTRFTVFDGISPDAPLPQIEQGIGLFKENACDAVVAIGGGSVIDAAKAIALAAANGKHPRALVGYFRGLHGPAPIYAVPTTAGTGSEVTVAAVISDPEQGCKLVIADTRIVPTMAALDPVLMVGLPPATTAATGLDALTHAVEAYIGQWGTPHTDRLALAAVAMIYRHLPQAYADGADLAAREQMALAATYAGLAFTRANVGNVHAIAHQLGGKYHVPHGLANAILLPGVLRFSAPAVTAKLAVLARHAGVGQPGDNTAALARRFVESVQALNDALGIPRQLDALQATDIPALAGAACWEADANYPVPRRMRQEDCETLLRGVLPARADGPAAPEPPPRRAERAPSARRRAAAIAPSPRGARPS
jgi:alcohol dehydrogenase class IV